MKAQILAKVSQALSPTVLDFSDYDILFFITCIISKPGIPLSAETDYSLLLQKVSGRKDKNNVIVNITVIQHDITGNKENIPDENASKLKKKTVQDPATLPGNVKKASNIQALQEHWACEKKQLNCLGMYCWVDSGIFSSNYCSKMEESSSSKRGDEECLG
jgi:hypothetical protein